VGDLIDLDERRRKRRTLAMETMMPANPYAFIFGGSPNVRITSSCSGISHSFPEVPGYCECGQNYYDGKSPGTAVFTDKSTNPRGGTA
jgi:hypothetical protein